MIEKLRDILKQRRKHEGDAIKQIAGEDFVHWGQYSQEDLHKLEDLCECLLYEIRIKKKITQEEEATLRMGYKRLTGFIDICRTVYSLDKGDESHKDLKTTLRNSI